MAKYEIVNEHDHDFWHGDYVGETPPQKGETFTTEMLDVVTVTLLRGE